MSEDRVILNCEMPEDTALLSAENWVPSPNFNERQGEIKPGGTKVDLLLLHYTATPTNEYALELLTSPEAGVSSHYLVDGMGRIIQMVAEGHRAWHAGEAEWAGEADINSCSIGIEIQNQGYALSRVPAYGRAQMAMVTLLAQDIVRRHKIPSARVLGHSDVAPHRKQDPGAHFNWHQLAEAGAGIWLDPSLYDARESSLGECLNLSPDEIMGVQTALSEIGYGLKVSGETDPRTQLVVTAFQRHFRPALVDGQLDWQTLRMIEALLGAIKA